MAMTLTAPEAARFIKYIDLQPTGCWRWTGGLTHGNGKTADPGGYGKFWLRGRTVLAHRVMYTAKYGSIAGTVDHLCRNPACVNPRHLEDVPMGVNILRGNSYMAQNARKTHCKRGHPLEGSNLVFVPGGRMCRACRNASFRAYRVRKRGGE